MEPQVLSYKASPRRPDTYRNGNKQEEGSVAFGKQKGEQDFLSFDPEMKTVMIKREQNGEGGAGRAGGRKAVGGGGGEKCRKLSP